LKSPQLPRGSAEPESRGGNELKRPLSPNDVLPPPNLDGQTLAQAETAEDNQCRYLPRPGPNLKPAWVRAALDCELGVSPPPPDLDAGDKTTVPRSPPRPVATIAAGDRFTFAVRAVILLVRCRGAMLATGTRPLFAWAASAALLRHRCRNLLCERFEQLICGSAWYADWISWPKSLPKAAGGGMADAAANLNGSTLDDWQLEAADTTDAPTWGAAQALDSATPDAPQDDLVLRRRRPRGGRKNRRFG
jgi:hypothetical protein